MVTSESTPNFRFYALVPCAGTGTRSGKNGPKQYERIAGHPMVWYTLAAFGAVRRIVVAAPDYLASGGPPRWCRRARGR